MANSKSCAGKCESPRTMPRKRQRASRNSDLADWKKNRKTSPGVICSARYCWSPSPLLSGYQSVSWKTIMPSTGISFSIPTRPTRRVSWLLVICRPGMTSYVHGPCEWMSSMATASITRPESVDTHYYDVGDVDLSNFVSSIRFSY